MEADTVLEVEVHAEPVDTGAPVVRSDMDKKAIRNAFLSRPPNQIVTLIKS